MGNGGNGDGNDDELTRRGPAHRLAKAGRATPSDGPSSQTPYRLRDLPPRGKLWAAAFAVALLLAPLLAFIDVVDDWVPSNDPALMGVQSLEVLGGDLPLTGQPSTSGHYVDDDRHVDHLGPLHFYMMAVPMRVLGPAVGMLSVSVLIISTCALLMAWAFFRRLGPTGGIVGATLVGLVMFTTGASTLMTPVSSNMAGYPLSCSAVLLWCVMRGDLRLLPVATAVTTFAAQMHLSVTPAVAVLAPAALAGLLWHWGRGGGWTDLSQLWRRLRTTFPTQLLGWLGGAVAAGLVVWWTQVTLREQSPVTQLGGMMVAAVVPGLFAWRARAALQPRFTALAQFVGWAGAAVVVGLLLWSPMLTQEVQGDPGNLSNLVDLTLNDERPTLGTSSAIDQVTHVIGLPPLLGRTDLAPNSAHELVDEAPSTATTASAVAVLALLAFLAVRWHRKAPEKQSLVIWAGVLMVVGIVNGSSVVTSVERWRMVLYHWIWSLTLFTTLALALGAIDGIRALSSYRSPLWKAKLNPTRLKALVPAARPALASVALLAIAVPSVVNSGLDRPSNELNSFRVQVERRYIEETVRQILEHRDVLEEPVVVLSRGAEEFTDVRDPLSLYLIDEGIDVRLPERMRYFVANRLLARDDHSTNGLLVMNEHDPQPTEVDVGTLIADVTTVEDFDTEAYDAALAAVEAVDTFQLGPEFESYLAGAGVPDEWVEAALEGTLSEIDPNPEGDVTVGEFSAYGKLHILHRLKTTPAEALNDPAVLDFLVEYPLGRDALAPELVERLRASEIGSQPGNRPLRIRVYLLEGHELDDVGFPSENLL